IASHIDTGAWRLLREHTDILLEATPKGIQMGQLVRDMQQVKGIYDVHDLHVWSIASGLYALSCHAQIDDQQTSQSAVILRQLETELSEQYHIGHTAIQFECHAHQEQYCSVDGLYCRMEATQEAEHDQEPTASTT